ncbi:MAG: hypothetical protein PHX27_04180 [Candidatus ainarchaeum sp.]|nr:hypothetical protein [Candidatus ainarchaeum sp.]
MKKSMTVLIALIFVVFLLGCTTTNNDNTNLTNSNLSSQVENNATGRTVIALTDAAADMGVVNEVKVTINSVQVYNLEKGWVTVSTESKTYDLLELNFEGKTVVLADVNIATDNYTKIKLNISNIVINDDKGKHTAAIPSNEIIVDAIVNVGENSANIATFDIIANESLNISSTGDYVFAPVVKIETKSDAKINIEPNGNVIVSGGKTQTNVKVGMDLNGKVGVGASVLADAEISTIINALGQIKIDLGENNKPVIEEDNSSTNNNTKTTNNNSMQNGENVFSDFVATISLIGDYKVAYNVNTGGQTSVMTQYVKDGEIRTDSQAAGYTARAYILSNGMFTCSQVAGWLCFDFTQQTESSLNSGFELIKENPNAYQNKLTGAGTKVVLDQTTQCYTISDTDAITTYCLNSVGVPLFLQGTANDVEWSMIATSYSNNVLTSDLKLPAEPQQFNYPQ